MSKEDLIRAEWEIFQDIMVKIDKFIESGDKFLDEAGIEFFISHITQRFLFLRFYFQDGAEINPHSHAMLSAHVFS